jgi:transcription-repair coupling factor (superfamily II helicase)
MRYFTDKLKGIDEYRDVLGRISGKSRRISITGPSDSQKVHLCHAIAEHAGRRGIYVTYNEFQARKAFEDFSMLLGENALLFPAREVLMHDIEARSNESEHERIKALHRIITGEYGIIVASAEAMALKLVSPGVFKESTIEVGRNSIVDPGKISEKLVSIGYERVFEVEARGQFSIRGGILDIFSVNSSDPVRIELFGDEVESVRYFDAESQRSLGEAEKAVIIPAREVIYPGDRLDDILSRIGHDLDNSIKLIEKKDRDIASALREKVTAHIDKIINNRHLTGIDKYIPYIADPPSTLTDYADEGDIIFIDEISRVRNSLETLLLDHGQMCSSIIEKGGMLPASCEIYFGYGEAENRLARNTNVLLSTLAYDEYAEKADRFTIPSRSLGSYGGRMEMLINDIRAWKSRNYCVGILAGTETKARRMREELDSQGVAADYSDNPSVQAKAGQVIVMPGMLNKGFEYPSAGLVVVSEAELFRASRRAIPRRKIKKGREIEVFTELKKGDYVVHQVHGIGRYLGLEKLFVENVQRDYLKIGYRDGDFLYIPTNQLDLVQKYIGVEGRAPRLSKLGGSEWTKTKKKVKGSLKKLAGDLLDLYARRETTRGFAFPQDTVWQREFEESFPYDETEDQLRCTEEIKGDMESERPVDRLLCGDVGYGKTEVAMRAAFKAVTGGKQVAFLVPTTVLAQQHYMTFTSRMKDFPITIDVLSRFRLPSEQKRILDDIRRGTIDIIIGTHRMLSKDVVFKNLGLLVVDEEQRFGVLHKERIKNLSPEIDVLTLTATPIPRTLHMSLAGIRDISVIEQPPKERYPVQTYVMEYNEDVIRDAINRELARGGQVFYLSNRVHSIDSKVAAVKKIVPDARIASAHGQMNERRLEEVMMKFINREFDVLVCTTIIESGLDMPNVNTIIVEDADFMGLSQLYQLRGRVGRSNRVAYAYITYRRDKVLTEPAEKRLQAIKEFTEFGSGFRIAMRDLEIRGAGNLLGPEQHGHMTAVGYDMYCRLLDQAVKELKGEPVKEEADEISIDLGINAYIDSDYISNESYRIEMYKKIASIETREDAEDIIDELRDRFGELPQPVKNLIDIAYIKALAQNIGISSVNCKGEKVIFSLQHISPEFFGVIGKLAEKYRKKILFNAGNKPYLTFHAGTARETVLADNIKILLQDIKSFVEKQAHGV